MKIVDAITELEVFKKFDVVVTKHVDVSALTELRDAPFPCGFAESVVHDAVKGVRPVTIECVAGMCTTDEVRGIIADLIRAVDEAESR